MLSWCMGVLVCCCFLVIRLEIVNLFIALANYYISRLNLEIDYFWVEKVGKMERYLIMKM